MNQSGQLKSLETYGISRPEKINWRFPTLAVDILTEIKSKSLQRFLRRFDEVVAAMSLEVVDTEMTETSFAAWLPYYQSRMEANNYELIASMDWYHQRLSQEKKVRAVHITQQSILVGSLVYVETPEKGTIAFRANDKLELPGGGRSSIGVILDYIFVKNMLSKKKEIISAGRSRNAFGVINTIGNLDYKLRFGYKPQPDPSAGISNTVPINSDGMALFFGLKQDKVILFSLIPKGTQFTFESTRFATDEMPFETLEYETNNS